MSPAGTLLQGVDDLRCPPRVWTEGGRGVELGHNDVLKSLQSAQDSLLLVPMDVALLCIPSPGCDYFCKHLPVSSLAPVTLEAPAFVGLHAANGARFVF